MYDFLQKTGAARQVHLLKLQSQFFQAAFDRIKTFEIRSCDRDYKVGDILVLYEWDPNAVASTGRAIVTNPIPYILSGCYGLETIDCCVIAFTISFTIDNFEIEYENGLPVTTVMLE